MIPALIALFSVLFLGGPGEIFYVDNLEKGVKKYIIEKERKKEILADIKSTKTLFKDFEKQRKKDYKQFENLYADKQTTTNDFDIFFDKTQKKRFEFQDKIINKRVLIFKKINPEEWTEIVESSVTKTDKRLSKSKKKASKGKADFAKTKAYINSNITDIEQKQAILDGLQDIIDSTNELESQALSVNTSQNKILADKNSGEIELLEIFEEDNNLRKPVLKSLVSFHELVRVNSSDAEFEKIMKSFLKEANMSSR